MKKLLFIPIIAAAAAITLGGCKDKKPAEDNIITTRYVPQRPQAPIAMDADSQTAEVTWLGKPYSVIVSRTPMDSVTVSDDNGQKYIDNSCRITVKREDGSVFAEKTFTKGSFLSYISEPFVSDGILAGIQFDEADGNKLEFSVVVAIPDAVDDLFVPLELGIDNQGGISIKLDDDMGMRDYEDNDEEEGV